MTQRFMSIAVDIIWPTLDGDSNQHEKQENEKLAKETQAVSEAVANLPSDLDDLKEYLAASEKLLDAEGSRKSGIESRLLNAAGLVSIAGTVVLGTLFSLAGEKLTLGPPPARAILTVGCLYLSLQLVAALHSAVKGLQAAGYVEDQPHELLPRNGLKHTVYVRERIERLLVRVAEHRRVNNGKLDQLKIAHCAMRNFLWGLLGVAVIASAVSIVWPPSPSEASCPTGARCGPKAQDGELRLELFPTKARPQETFIRRLVTVGPFPDGDHLLSEEQIAKCVLSAIDKYKGLRIGGWELVGRVDKRRLKEERMAIYGSNQALAMARASWVARKILTSQPSFDLAHAVITIGGARGVGAPIGTTDLQSDRAVDVFALVNARTAEEGSDELPDPVVCPPPAR